MYIGALMRNLSDSLTTMYNKYTKKIKNFNWSRDYSRSKEVLKQDGVVHNIKSQ